MTNSSANAYTQKTALIYWKNSLQIRNTTLLMKLPISWLEIAKLSFLLNIYKVHKANGQFKIRLKANTTKQKQSVWVYT